MSEGRTDIKKGIFRRVRVLYALFFFVGMLIAGKILYLQYGPKGPALRNKGTTITYERVKLEADRGDVLACDGRILATSVPMYEVRMDFAANGLIDSVFLRDVDSLAGSLSSFFGDKSKGAYKLMLVNAFRNRKKNRYTLISPRRVNHLEIKQIAKFPLFRLGQNRSGFIARQINKRMLPHGRMAARTIGMVNEAGTRLGIEGAFDSVLRGIDGSVMMQRVSGSFRVPVPDEMNVDPVDGIDVVTTLDVDIQDVAEKALRDQLIAMQADWGTAILMEVATGEIRAMANLTRYSDERVVEDFNYAIGMNLEPGSTEKLASLITLLDDAGASLDETYDTGDGRIVIGRAKVVDSHACGLLTLKGVFEKSSNVGFAMAVNKYYRDDPKRFVDHLCKMGLDQPLGLQIAGEQKPVIRKPGDKWWDGTTLTMMSYGYALRLTPLKTLTFYNAVANGGKMVSPLLVKELRQYGQTLRTFGARTMVSSIASRETLEEVREAMRGVVEEGTARRMRSRYYSVGGKTGTAQIAMGRSGYTDRNGGRHYLGTFVGYFPEDDPKYSCLVAVKTYNAPGHRRYYYGGTVAGPVFKAIADRVYAKNTAWQKPVSETGGKSAKKPFVKAGRVEQMREVGYRFDIPYEGRRREKPWKELASIDSTGAVYTEYDERGGKVPCVVGMGLKDAIYLLERQGMIVSFSGAGTVLSQSVPAGSKARRGQTVSLILGVEPLPEGETVRPERTRRTE
ncbi:penicillin-binding protein [Alistipes ihumii]|uniref:penicillin-binding protein n=1 Tax=Alistipes ihumii TaxID=1470347 RepID=UPI003AB7F9F7